MAQPPYSMVVPYVERDMSRGLCARGVLMASSDRLRDSLILTRENAALRKRLEAAGVGARADPYWAGNRPQPRVGIGGGRGG